jgi:16S rRNA (adenine1518-N6/adenine1519-N6)-dimethyltransferase
MNVKAKKHLGQHFLINTAVCEKIAEALPVFATPMNVVEIGPGKGAITDFFLKRTDIDFCAFEVDLESVLYLKKAHPTFNKVYSQDFLEANFSEYFQESQFCVVGNFPYNISSQILFKCLESRDQIPLILGMFQKEVARRIAEPPGSKEYGILSVLMQAYYEVSYLFTVEPGSFYPPPKVKSGVIRCVRNSRTGLGCDEKLFVKVVKAAFNQRRKTLRNSIRAVFPNVILTEEFESQRPEQLSVASFIKLTQLIEPYVND